MIPVRLQKGKESELLAGFPWVYTAELIESSQWLLMQPGELVAIENHKGQRLATGYANPKSTIAVRVLTRGSEPIDEVFFKTRLEKAIEARASIGVPFYRLSHGEADDLPGLLIDRFGDIVVVQVGTAGTECLKPVWLPALEALLKPKAIVFRNDLGARKLEGLSQVVQVKGTVPELVEVLENGCVYYADLIKGQKTGWFYDQRDNRRMIAELAKGKSVADVYSHSGGFGVIAARLGAKSVTMVDSSKLALELAAKAAEKNGVASLCDYRQGDAVEVMQAMAKEGLRFDIVLADPPAYVKSRKDIVSGMKGYEKVARAAAALVAPNGLLFSASCSHHASRGAFNNAVMSGIEKAGRSGKILKQTGAAHDHPRHPKLPQSEYLKGLLVEITN